MKAARRDVSVPSSQIVTEVAIVAGIVFGGGGLVGAFVAVYRAKPETQTLVMSTGETGVKILDNVIDTLQSEVERMHGQHARYEERLDAMQALVEERNARIQSEQETYRTIIAEKDAELRRTVAQVDELLRQVANLTQEAVELNRRIAEWKHAGSP